jgi:hypothetical protein
MDEVETASLLVRAAEDAMATGLPILERSIEKVYGSSVVKAGGINFDNVVVSTVHI